MKQVKQAPKFFPRLFPRSFQSQVLNWFDNFGRKNLPWQQAPTPYHVWLSEIMLQQTQVTTVIPYYTRFIEHFPDLHGLAKAPLDKVLSCWAGLGYYARARHLHRTAKILVQDFQGQFPTDLSLLQSLPGIGRSTAGAILSLGFNIPAPILDGNVKRVLCRYFAIDLPPSDPKALQQLWHYATHLTPKKRNAAYTQAMMDLGAMVCTRSKPNCQICPLKQQCRAFQSEKVAHYPIPKARKVIPIREIRMLIIRDPKGAILLQKRPPVGIWGGLWSLPECAHDVDINTWCQEKLGLSVKLTKTWPSFRHTFSHFHLDITPILLSLNKTYSLQIMENQQQVWYKPNSVNPYALAAPVKTLLQQLEITDDAAERILHKTSKRSPRLRKTTSAR